MPLPSFKDFARKQYYQHMGWGRPSKPPTKPVFEYIFRDLDSNENLTDKVGNPFKVRAFSDKQAVWYLKRDHPIFRHDHIGAIKIPETKILFVPPPKSRPIEPPKTIQGELGLDLEPTKPQHRIH